MLVQDGREIETQNKLVVICHQIWHQTLRNEHTSGQWNNSGCYDFFERERQNIRSNSEKAPIE